MKKIKWLLTFILISGIVKAQTLDITTLEYWFDNDFAVSTTVNVPGKGTLNIGENLDVSSLGSGLHTVHFRAKDERNIWSPAVSRFFTVSPGSGTPTIQKIVAFEYWFNNDYSTATFKSTGMSGTYNLDELIDVSSLKNRLQTVHYRFKDEKGAWSPVLSRFFKKYEPENSCPDNKITAYRYWIDEDQGSLKTIELSTPSKIFVLDENFTTSGLPSGEHFLNIQFRDQLGHWCPAVGDTVILEPSPWAELSVSATTCCMNEAISFSADTADATEILWDFGDGNTSPELEPEHSYSMAGKYGVKATLTHMPSGKSEAFELGDSIVVLPAITTAIETAICESELPFTFGTQTITDAGEFTEAFTSANGCDSIVTLTLIVNPKYDETETVSVFESELPYTFGTQTLTGAGEYTETFTSVNSCDSVVHLTLNVNYQDITPPVATCQPINIVLDNSGHYTLTPEDAQFIVAGSFDNKTAFENLRIDISTNSFDCRHAGTYVQLKATVTDEAGNKDICYTVASIYDDTAPQMICEETTLSLDENGELHLSPNDLCHSFEDACGIFSKTPDKTFFNCDDLGENKVVITVSDNHENTSQDEIILNIIDDLKPVFVDVEDIFLTVDEGKCSIEFEYPEITATDNCQVEDIHMVSGLGPDASFPVGSSVEKWVAIDKSGNSDTLVFQVNVLGNPAPPSMASVADQMVTEDSTPIMIPLSDINDGLECELHELEMELNHFDEQLIDSYEINYNQGEINGTLIINLVPNANGQSDLKLILTNTSTGLKSEVDFKIEVLPVNDPPILVSTIEDVMKTTKDTFLILIPSTKGIIFDDTDENDPLNVSVTLSDGNNLPLWLSYKNDSLVAISNPTDTGCVNLMVKATDLQGEEVATNFSLCVGYPVGVNTSDHKPSVLVYPNPSSGKVYLSISNIESRHIDVSLFDLTGRQIMHRSAKRTNIIEIDISNQVNGIYLMTVGIDEFQKKFKIILNH